MGIELVTDATVEPIKLDEAWRQCSIDPEGSPESTAHDALLSALISAARAAAEEFTGRSFAAKRWRLTLDGFPGGAIELRHPPLDSIVSVEYVDASGDLQTMDAADYAVDKTQVMPWLLPAFGMSWPSTASVANAVRVTFDSGYTGDAIPPQARAAILMTVGHLFKNREAVTDVSMIELPIGIEYLLRPLRVRLGMA